MNLLVSLLLLTAALAVVVRIFDARRTLGWMLLVVLFFGLTGVATSRVGHWASYSGAALVGASEAVADASASPADEAASQESAAQPAGEDADRPSDESAEQSEEEAASEAPAGQSPAGPATDAGQASDSLSIEVQAEPGEVVIPPRPEWVESEDVRDGRLHTTAVSSGPHETERDCRTYLDRELKLAVDRYVDWYLGRLYGDRFRASTFVSYDLPYIKEHLVRRGAVHHEVIRVSFGPMHQMHALLEFSPEFRTSLDGRKGELDRHWREWIVQGRLWSTALTLGTILALLAVFVGYSRADTATRGFYTVRLQLLAAVAILTIIAAVAVLALRLVA